MKFTLYTSNISAYKQFTQSHRFFSLWQSVEWKDFQESIGRKVFLVGIEKESNVIATALIIKHPLPFQKCWFEIPRGPLIAPDAPPETFDFLLQKIREVSKMENAIYARLNPFQNHLKTLSYKLKPSFTDHHPQTSLLINLNQSEEDILKQMKPKGRYNIKLAKKHGVEIVQGTDAKPFYDILQETTQRDGFRSHNLSYYQKMIDSLQNNGALYYAQYNNEIIAGGIFTYVGNTAVYYYGASSNTHRNVMAPYLIQWKAILEAKKRKCHYYDFLGIAPEGSGKQHDWYGVTSFKKKFGGVVKNYPHSQDYVMQKWWYFLLKCKQKLR